MKTSIRTKSRLYTALAHSSIGKQVVLILVLAGCLAPVFCQIATVSGVLIMPVEATQEASFEVLAKTMHETIRLNLALMREFRTVIHQFPQGQLRYGISKYQYARNVMREEGCDNAVFVEIDRQNTTDPILVSITVYAYTTGDVTIRAEEQLESIFDIFDAADRLTLVMLEGFIGRPIEYGSLRLNSPRTSIPYLVYIDQVFIGENVNRVPTLRTDEYQVRITQKRLWGEVELQRTAITISADKETLVEFNAPDSMRREQEQLAELDNQLRDYLDKKDTESAKRLLANTIEELDQFKDIPGFGQYSQWRQRYSLWQEMLEYNLRLGMVATATTASTRTTASYPEQYYPAELADYLPDNTAGQGSSLVSITTRMDQASDIPFRLIHIDGDFSDWEGIKEVRDPGGQGNRYTTPPSSLNSMRIKSFSLARDNRYLYLRMRMDDRIKIENIERTLGPSYSINFRTSTHSLTLSLNWWNGWDCQLYLDSLEGGKYQRLTNGSWRYNEDSFEMAVPIDAVLKHLEPGQRYELDAKTGSVNLSITSQPSHASYHRFRTSLRF